MNASWLYHQNPLFIILTLLLAMTTAAEVGFRLGRRWHARSGDAGRAHFGSILGSLLGLLALLLSFTFAMSANRFDSRRQLVLADANALETLYLQSDLLPDASRKAFKQSLRQYVDLRSQIALLRHDATPAEAAALSDKSDAIHAQMWKAVKEAAQANPPAKIADEMLKGLAASLSIHRNRMFAWESRVPDSVIWLLLFGCVAGITAIGLAGGLGNHRGLPARIIVTFLLCATIFVVLDLDRPHEGLISVSQSPILHLQKILDRDTETNP
jgi:hypothetical protein